MESSTDNSVDLSAVPSVKEGLDLNNLDLTQEEGFVFSRIDGQASLEQIIKASGMEQEKAMAVLDDLREKGVISFDGANGQQGEGDEEFGGMVFDPFELAEEIDLKQETKKRILYLKAKMNEMTHYQMLEIGRRADSKEIKKAYFQVSKEFHPDSYFRKNLGSYKSKIELIFKQISTAYEILSNPQKREAYDKTLPYEPTPEEIEEKKQAEKRKERDQRLKEERRRRLLRRTPIARQKAKARGYLEDAKKAMEEGEDAKAWNNIKLAMTLDPDSEEIIALHDKIEPKASEVRANKEFRRGQGEESMGRQEEALAAYLRAIEANPDDTRSLTKAAALMLELDCELRDAVNFCRRVKEIDSDNSQILLTLAKIYNKLGMYKNAVRELNTYVSANPLDERATEMLKELKKKQ